MSADAAAPQGTPVPGPWSEMGDRYLARCGAAWVSNQKDPNHCGIFQSRPRSPAALVSPFYIEQMRRYPGTPLLYDVTLHNPQTQERIEVVRADADEIARTINAWCGFPRGPIKGAVYALLSSFYWERVDRRRDH